MWFTTTFPNLSATIFWIAVAVELWLIVLVMYKPDRYPRSKFVCFFLLLTFLVAVYPSNRLGNPTTETGLSPNSTYLVVYSYTDCGRYFSVVRGSESLPKLVETQQKLATGYHKLENVETYGLKLRVLVPVQTSVSQVEAP
jgi:hypothetical protein